MTADERFFIGTSPRSDVRVTDSYASFVHASVTMRDGVLYVRDEGSMNGTFVNRRLVKDETPLLENGYVHVGGVRLTYDELVERIRNRD